MQKDTKAYNFKYVKEDAVLFKIKDKMNELEVNEGQKTDMAIDAIKKYGKHNFNKEILVRDVDDFETLCELERYYIQLYDTKNKGYNMTDGGLGMYGYEPTEEHRKNMSKSLSGENHPQYGIKRSKETRLKLSEKAKLRKGRPVSEETRKKISESLKKRKI